jgi:hypothetical protein
MRHRWQPGNTALHEQDRCLSRLSTVGGCDPKEAAITFARNYDHLTEIFAEISTNSHKFGNGFVGNKVLFGIAAFFRIPYAKGKGPALIPLHIHDPP